MPQVTFDPINGPFDARPPHKPGTVIVAFRDGVSEQIDASTRSAAAAVSLESLMSPRVLASIAVGLAVMAWLGGLIGLLVGVAAAAAITASLFVNRHSALSKAMLGRYPSTTSSMCRDRP
jgi:hypothetical protein